MIMKAIESIYFLQLVYDFLAFFGLVFSVAYLECVRVCVMISQFDIQ